MYPESWTHHTGVGFILLCTSAIRWRLYQIPITFVLSDIYICETAVASAVGSFRKSPENTFLPALLSRFPSLSSKNQTVPEHHTMLLPHQAVHQNLCWTVLPVFSSYILPVINEVDNPVWCLRKDKVPDQKSGWKSIVLCFHCSFFRIIIHWWSPSIRPCVFSTISSGS